MFFKKKKKKVSTKTPSKVDIEKFKNLSLEIAGNKPMTEAFLNSFFNVFTPEQILYFEKLYKELKPKLEVLKIDGPKFMEYVRDAYSRYQEYKKLDPFYPMDKKGQKYVENFIRESVERAYQGVKNKSLLS